MNLTIIRVGRSSSLRERRHCEGGCSDPAYSHCYDWKSHQWFCMTDTKRIMQYDWSVTSSLLTPRSCSVPLAVPPPPLAQCIYIYLRTRAGKAAKGGEMVPASTAPVMHVSGRQSSSEAAFPSVTAVRRCSPVGSDSAGIAPLESLNAHNCWGGGGGIWGWQVRGGEGAEVRVECICVCESVSIVTWDVFSLL